MNRLVALLMPVVLAACTAPIGAPGGTAERDPREAACRAEATRVVQWRDRGQLMRTDEAENSRGTQNVIPYSRVESDRGLQQMERDRLTAECLRGSGRN